MFNILSNKLHDKSLEYALENELIWQYKLFVNHTRNTQIKNIFATVQTYYVPVFNITYDHPIDLSSHKKFIPSISKGESTT